MSIIAQAERELNLINFGEEDTKAMLEILTKFFDTWDSGGAVWAAAPILMRCIAGKPLSPLTGADDEWNEVGNGVFQNNRCSSVFKEPDGLVHDIDADDPVAPITFPYNPDKAEVSSPFMIIGD